MLDFQLVQAPMRFGLAEGVEPHQVPFGTLMTAENVCWTKSGLLEHRPGSRALDRDIVGGGSLSSAARLIIRGDELGVTDGESLYAHTALGWAPRGAIPNIGITWETMTVGLNTVRSADLAVSGTTITEAWVSGEQDSDASNRLTYQVSETETGALVTAPTVVAGAKPRDAMRVVADGTDVWIVYAQLTSPHNGSVYVLPVGGTAVEVATNAVLGANEVFALDAVVIGSDILIAYSLDAGGIGLLRVSATSTPTVSTTGSVTGETSDKIGTLSLAGAASEPMFVAWATIGDGSGTDKVRYACADATTLSQTLAPQDLYVTGGVFSLQVATVTSVRFAASEALLCYHLASQDIGTSFLYSHTVDSVGTVGESGGDDRTFAVLSRPANIGSRWLVTVANYPGEAGSFFTTGTTIPTSEVLVLDITPSADRAGFTPVQQGKIECLSGGFWSTGVFSNVSGGYVATPFVDAAPYGASGMVAKALTGARRTKFTASGGDDMWRSVAIGHEVAFAAGTLCSYDGERARAFGFATGPLVSYLFTNTATTGGSIAAGRYLYNVTAERRSATGLLYRSPVGITHAITTTGATSFNTVGVVASALDRSDTNPGAFLGYRSVVDGSVVQRIATPPMTMTLAIGSNTHTISDDQSDSQAGLSIRPALYTEGGELEDMQPPSPLTITLHQNRVWLISGDGMTLWFSKDRSVNAGIAPGFHPSLTLTFDRRLTAIIPLDDKLVVFAEKTFWVVLGQGPAPSGQNGTYEVVGVQTDVGCDNPRSLVSTPDGILFECERGIYLLTRALELQWVGRPIKDELVDVLEEGAEITSAVLVAARNEVRFTVTRNVYGPGDGAPSINTRSAVLVYNYVERQWTTSVYTVDGTYGAIIADACMWQGRWTAVTAAGTVFYETDEDGWDGEGESQTWTPATIETAWVTASGPLAYQSVRKFSLEGVAQSAHSLTIDVGFDSDDAYPQTKTFDVDAGAESFDISIGTRRKCRSIRFRISDAAPTGEGDNTGKGLSLAMLGIEVGLKRGFAKKPATKTG